MRWSMLCCLWHRTTRLVAFGNKLCLKNTSFALGWTALCLLIIMGQSKIYSLVSLKGILDKSPDDQKQCQSGKIAIHSWWWPYTIWWTILHFIYQYSHYEKMYREHIILICYLRQINQNILYLLGTPHYLHVLICMFAFGHITPSMNSSILKQILGHFLRYLFSWFNFLRTSSILLEIESAG